MNDWKLALVVFLQSLGPCGLMLLVASNSRLIAAELRWPARVIALLLSAPSIIFMLWNLRFRQETCQDEDEVEELDFLHVKPDAEPLANEDPTDRRH
jgi:hypothetical protein